jgi:hypothetical protein
MGTHTPRGTATTPQVHLERARQAVLAKRRALARCASHVAPGLAINGTATRHVAPGLTIISAATRHVAPGLGINSTEPDRFGAAESTAEAALVEPRGEYSEYPLSPAA